MPTIVLSYINSLELSMSAIKLREMLGSKQPPGTLQIEPAYRKAHDLPIRFSKKHAHLSVGGNAITANTHEEKAAAFAERFFPHPVARTSDIPEDTTHRLDTALFPSEDHFTQEEIKEIIKRLPSWKAPGLDELPAGFLKACGPALTKVL
ncbi:hypothetical protein E4U52_006762, partial [Claviceps spartinae]